MAQLAIKAHPTRTKEVIEILEMLGGKNRYHFKGDEDEWFVLNRNIQRSDILFDEKGFTLEEFLEIYPYKVGDKVYNIIHNENQIITDLAWEFQEDEVVYQTNNNEYVYVNYLQPYKEEIMNKNNKREKAIELINAYFDGKDIIMKDPEHGIPDWISIKHPEYWSYLDMFCREVDKYKIVEESTK